MSKGCPHCGKAPYPVKNEDGSINWKNVFRIDWITVFLVISIILMLVGFKQINAQCYDYLEHPCDKFKEFCSPTKYSQNNIDIPPVDISSITLDNDKVVIDSGTD